MKLFRKVPILLLAIVTGASGNVGIAADKQGTELFESKIRPILVKHCYECHSEETQTREGGLLLDRPSGWLEGGDTDKAVIPGEPDTSLLIVAVKYGNDDLQMPPEGKLSDEDISLLTKWVGRGAPGPLDDMGETEFSRLGDQDFLFGKAAEHWAFQPVDAIDPPSSPNPRWNRNPIDRFVFAKLRENKLLPSVPVAPEKLARRLHFAATGLPPTTEQIEQFQDDYEKDRVAAIRHAVDQLTNSPSFGEHLGRLWLDVARYADTDSAYRPDTKTPYYFPFAFTYRDYVIDSLNGDKPFNQFVTEQFAADLIGFKAGDPEIAALGFFGTGPHAKRAQPEALDDWIDVTTRGLMGLTVACARCHDHKYEPVPTADYYSLRGVFAALDRIGPMDQKKQPLVGGYEPTPQQSADFEKKLAAIEKKISDAGGKKAKNNNRSLAERIRDTELAKLLTFHPGAPAHAMIVRDKKVAPASFIHVRGDATARGDAVPKRFLKILDSEQPAFQSKLSGRLELAKKIVDPTNPLTARVFVNRIWGYLVGSHIVATPSDFGLQGSAPTHPELLDWLTADFVAHDWSTKHLVRQILTSETFAQRSRSREDMEALDSQNTFLWRANRRHLTIEMLRDRVLAVSGQLDRSPRGRAEEMWGKEYTRRRAVYGFINRFNLDPTLRAFDFPAPMQSHSVRDESIVAAQALFTLNSPFVIDQCNQLAKSDYFADCKDDQARIKFLFSKVLQRVPAENELDRISKFVEFQRRLKKSAKYVDSPWPLVAQSLMMSNEFQYID